MFTQAEIYNIALSALLLKRQISNVATENNNEVTVLNQFWKTAFYSTLTDLDLDSTSTIKQLALITSSPAAPWDELWNYVYDYPNDCAHFRRIHSGWHKDARRTHIPKQVALYTGSKAIFTNEASAYADYIPNNITLNQISPQAAMAIGHRLAWLSTPLIVGKGANSLRQEIENRYAFHKAEAQEKDREENFSYHDESVESEWVHERMS